ncbi:uncharacterized protein LOC144161512 [Haemaphysalis longicornis]
MAKASAVDGTYGSTRVSLPFTLASVCVCTYCANFHLALVALQNASGRSFSSETVQDLYTCPHLTATCFLGDWERCPKAENLTLDKLHVDFEEEVVMASWESGDLIKKTMTSPIFLEELQRLTEKWVPHNFKRCVQARAIRDVKRKCERSAVVLHFDFAENWTIVLPDDVQGHHWYKRQISAFTCVVTSRKMTRNYAIICDDLSYDSTLACLALIKIKQHLKDNAPLYAMLTYVSDGAAASFKNKYQFHEMQSSECRDMKWIFTATGHGKNACDDVGGLVKHEAKAQNLRSAADEAIQSAKEFVNTLAGKVKNVVMMHMDDSELATFREVKKEEWKNVKPVPGIQSSHMWRSVKSHEGNRTYTARNADSEWQQRF